MESPTAGRGLAWLAARPGRSAVAIALAVLAAHGLGLGHGFTLDDGLAVTSHPVVQGQAPLRELLARTNWGAPLQSWLGFRPTTTLTFWLEWRLAGAVGAPPALVLHAGNLLWAFAASLAVLRLGGRLLGPPAALAAALAFSALAIHADVVASIANRGEAIACALGLAAVDGALFGRRPAWALAGAPALLLLALGAKESAFPLCALAAWLLLALPACRARRTARLGVALLCLVTAGALAPRLVAQRGQLAARAAMPGDAPAAGTPDNPAAGLPWAARLPTALALGARYVATTAAPRPGGHDFTYAVILPARIGDPAALAGLAGAALLAWAAVRDLRRGPGRLAALAGGLLGLGAFFAHAVVPLSVIYAERLWFTPSALVCWLGALGLEALAGRAPRAVDALVGAVLALQVIAALPRTAMWRDDLRLNAACVAETPENVRCHLHLAHALRERGAADAAVVHYALAALGRRAFPGPFRADRLAPLLEGAPAERLARLPEVLRGALGPGAAPWAAALARYLDELPAPAEAALARAVVARLEPR